MDIEQIKTELSNILPEKRYIHSINVMNTSKLLAEKYNENIRNAKLAGLLHDCARYLKGKEIEKLCGKYDIVIDDISRLQTELLHGPLGMHIARNEYGIHEPEILDAICNHTLGRENMSKLEKIIFIADYVEPGRDFKGVEAIRKALEKDLDKAIVLAYDSTIKFCMYKGKLIHPQAVLARNYIINQIRIG